LIDDAAAAVTAQEYGGKRTAWNVADLQIHETRPQSQPQQNTNSPAQVPTSHTQVLILRLSSMNDIS